MMRIITIDDILDTYFKIIQRGPGLLFSKLNWNPASRTKSAFSDSSSQSSNWWIIPEVKERWNEKITSSKHESYESYVYNKYLNNIPTVKMLSVGSGVCSHEMKFARHPNFAKIICVDIADNLLSRAEQRAKELDLQNIEFLIGDINELEFESDYFDVILFNSSLHHMSNVERLISEKVLPWLKPDGLVIINEYVGVNRLQYPDHQIKAINTGIQMIPEKYRLRYKSNIVKGRYYGSGILRMIIADPSECVESANILPTMNKYFQRLEYKPYGGNLLMSILKDISHNFVDSSDDTSGSILLKLFELEDAYLLKNKSDFVFGIYKNIG